VCCHSLLLQVNRWPCVQHFDQGMAKVKTYVYSIMLNEGSSIGLQFGD
jgi:hypothetical protein